MTELLSCPFCGSESVDPKGWLRNDGVSGPECDGCGATAESVEIWNTRALPAPGAAPPAGTSNLKMLLSRTSETMDYLAQREAAPAEPAQDGALVEEAKEAAQAARDGHRDYYFGPRDHRGDQELFSVGDFIDRMARALTAGTGAAR